MVIGRLGPEPCFDIGEGGAESAEVRLLRQVADPRARLDKAFAGIGLDETSGDPQQRRFAGAVSPDEAYPVSSSNGEARAGQ